METIVKNHRQETSEKGEDEMKTMVEKQKVERNTMETVAEQQTQKVIDKRAEVAEPVPGKTKEEKVSAEVTPNKGLCATCTEAPHCVYARNATAPILFCEMFDEGKPVEQVEPEKPQSSPQHSREEKPAGQLKGLCINCEHRGTCTFPKPEGGVWHCEEYR